MIYDAVIIGAGAAGLMCAVELEKEKLNYLVLEKNEQAGKKVLISGGTRCNVTNNLDIDEFINTLTVRNKKFLYPALYTFGPNQVIQFFRDNGLELILENNFKYFPKTNKSSSVLNVLLDNIEKRRIIYNSSVKDVRAFKDKYRIITNDNEYVTNNIVVATGSKSFPKTGSDGYGLKIAKKFDISYVDFTPAETHVYSNDIVKNYKELQGTAIQNTVVRIQNTKISYQGDVLFTHFGLSGPAIYHLSEFIEEQQDKMIRFALTSKTNEEVDVLLDNKNLFILKVLEQCLTKRVAKKILQELHIDNKRIAELSKQNLKDIKNMLFDFQVEIDRVESREKAYVNKGGILLKELRPSSMETKKKKGLFFVGETVDIHGPIGGYNITIAFATGILAALRIKESRRS